MGIAELGCAPLRVHIVRHGEYWEGKRTSCLVTYKTYQQAYAAVAEIDGMEVTMLADVPLECELLFGGEHFCS